MTPFDRLRYQLSTRGPALTFRLHRWVYRLTGGALAATSGRMPVLLLTSTGRRTGQPRTQLLSYYRDGDSYVLVASHFGRNQHPAWYLNLLAHPRATVQIGRRCFAVAARTATPDEKRRLWPVLAAQEPLYPAYQRRTSRDIPIVILRLAS